MRTRSEQERNAGNICLSHWDCVGCPMLSIDGRCLGGLDHERRMKRERKEKGLCTKRY